MWGEKWKTRQEKWRDKTRQDETRRDEKKDWADTGDTADTGEYNTILGYNTMGCNTIYHSINHNTVIPYDTMKSRGMKWMNLDLNLNLCWNELNSWIE